MTYGRGVKNYQQYCSIARGLDLVGDRWTLLMVRELLLRGPSRFTDIKSGLPGIAANILVSRLKELEQAGLVRREYAPPPVASQLYELTEDGRALEPVLRALGLWGLRYMAEERRGDAFRAEWLAYAPAWFTVDGDLGGPPATIQLEGDGERAVIELGDGSVCTRPGDVEDPDLTLTGPARSVLGVVLGIVDVKQAKTLGLRTRGDLSLLGRLRPVGAPDTAPR